MSRVHALVKRFADPEAHFKAVLDQLAADPIQDPSHCCLVPVEADGATQHPRQTQAHCRRDAPVSPDLSLSPRLRHYGARKMSLL